MSASRSVIVLGGSGFIGSAVVSAAVAAGFHVTALARSDAVAGGQMLGDLLGGDMGGGGCEGGDSAAATGAAGIGVAGSGVAPTDVSRPPRRG